MKFNKKYLALGVLGSALASTSAYAVTQSVTANLTFDSALTLTKTSDINFGTVQASTPGTYTIATTGVVTPSAGGVVIGGTPTAGAITIAGSTTQTVAISTGTYVANSGVTLSNATCSYNGGASTACDAGLTGQTAAGTGKTLKLGVQATSDGTAASGVTASPTFIVTVVYG